MEELLDLVCFIPNSAQSAISQAMADEPFVTARNGEDNQCSSLSSDESFEKLSYSEENDIPDPTLVKINSLLKESRLPSSKNSESSAINSNRTEERMISISNVTLPMDPLSKQNNSEINVKEFKKNFSEMDLKPNEINTVMSSSLEKDIVASTKSSTKEIVAIEEILPEESARKRIQNMDENLTKDQPEFKDCNDGSSTDPHIEKACQKSKHSKIKEPSNTKLEAFMTTLKKMYKFFPKFLDGMKGEKIQSDIDLLLLGKTGYGKSSTGNTILGHNNFKSSSSYTSVTTRVEHAYSKVGNRIIKIVDAPGILDTVHVNDMEKMTEDVIKKMEDAVSKHTKGYHAFLIVLKYGGRFGEDDTKVITMLKHIFGEDVVKYYCILLMTYGDNYRNCEENTGKEFETWCSEQTGVFAELYKECGNRAVLFDNQTKEESIINKQMKKLLKMIDNLQYHGRRYCDDHFKAAEEGRQRMLLEYRAPTIIEEIKEKCHICMTKFSKIITQDPEKQHEELFKMLSDIALLKLDADKQDNNYGVLTSALESLSQLETTIKTSIETAKISIDKKAKEEEKAQLTKQQNEKIEELSKNVQLTKEEKNKLSSEIDESKRKLEDYQKTIEEKEQQVKDTEIKREEDMKNMKEQYEKMMEEMRKKEEEHIQRLEEYAKEIEAFKKKTSTFGKRLNYACHPQ